MTVVLIILAVFAVIGLVVGVKRGASQTKQRNLGRNRCSYRVSRLKKTPDKLGYATTCKKCGRAQPWATV